MLKLEKVSFTKTVLMPVISYLHVISITRFTKTKWIFLNVDGVTIWMCSRGCDNRIEYSGKRVEISELQSREEGIFRGTMYNIGTNTGSAKEMG